MSKADKMFEELGYTKFNSDLNEAIIYSTKSGLNYARMDLTEKEVLIHLLESRKDSIQVHLAIHEKLKELGWIDVKL